MSDELDPSARDFLASALEDAPRLDDGARRRMRENVLTTIGAGAGVVAVAAAVKSAGASSAAATASIPAGAATASIPAGAATASIPAGAAATTTTVAATAATKAVTLGFFAKAAIAVGVGGLVTTAAVWQSSKNDPPPPPPAPTVVMTSTPAPSAPVAEAKPVVTEPTPAPMVEEKPVEEKPVVTAEAPKRAKVAVAEKPAPEEKPAAAATPAPTSTDFSKELDALDRARGALSGGDPAKALSVLDEGGGSSAAFVEERQALRIVALCSAGRGDEGRAALAAFRNQFPRSLQTARVTRACEPKAPVPTPAPGGVTPTKP